MSCSHLLNPWNIPRPPVLPVCVYIIYVYSYIYIYMYRYSPQTLHLFSSQITQTCHTIALLGPAKKAHQILLCWIYASFIPSLKKRNWSLWKHLPDSRNSKVTISPPYPNHQEDNRFERCWNQNPPKKKQTSVAKTAFGRLFFKFIIGKGTNQPPWAPERRTRRTRIIFEPFHGHCMRLFFCWWVYINWSKWMSLWCLWIDDTMAFRQAEMESNI